MHLREIAQTLLISIAALLTSVLIYAVFMAFYAGVDPRTLFYQIYVGGFGSAFSIGDTLTRASPLILTALCMALPARVGLINIGGEGALMIGALAAVCTGLVLTSHAPEWVQTAMGLVDHSPLLVQIAMALAGMMAGGALIALVGWMRHSRGINETISSLLLTYIVIAVFNYLVEGPLRDPASLNKPSTYSLPESLMLGNIIPESGAIREFLLSLGGWTKVFEDVHVGLLIGVVFCVFAYLLMYHTTFGFAARMVGGNVRAAQASGLAVGPLMLVTCFLGGSAAGLAGMVQMAATEGKANATLNAGYGFTGILVSFMARHHPLVIIPVAILFGGLDASKGLVQRELHVPDASSEVFKGIVFVVILAFETFYGRFRVFQPRLTTEVAPA